MRIKDYPETEQLSSTDKLLVDGDDGTRSILVNKIALYEDINDAIMFLSYISANHIGPLYLISETEGDKVQIGGRYAVNTEGAKSIVLKGSTQNSISGSMEKGRDSYVIISTTNNAWTKPSGDTYGGLSTSSPNGGKFITPKGNEVWIGQLGANWEAYLDYDLGVTIKGIPYIMHTKTYFGLTKASVDWALRLADLYLFEGGSILSYNDTMQSLYHDVIRSTVVSGISWDTVSPSQFNDVFGSGWESRTGTYTCRANVSDDKSGFTSEANYNLTYSIMFRVWYPKTLVIEITDNVSDSLSYRATPAEFSGTKTYNIAKSFKPLELQY